MLTLVTAPVSEPIPLEDAKEHLRVDDANEDAYIASLIQVARDYVEGVTGLAFVSQQWLYTADQFPYSGYWPYGYGSYGAFAYATSGYNSYDDTIKLYRAPLISVQSITYIDPTGNTQTLASNQYTVLTSSTCGEIALNYGCYWPFTRPVRNAVNVTFTAGYASVDLIPESYLGAIKYLIADMYMNREASVDGMRANANPLFQSLITRSSLPGMA